MPVVSVFQDARDQRAEALDRLMDQLESGDEPPEIGIRIDELSNRPARIRALSELVTVVRWLDQSFDAFTAAGIREAYRRLGQALSGLREAVTPELCREFDLIWPDFFAPNLRVVPNPFGRGADAPRDEGLSQDEELHTAQRTTKGSANSLRTGWVGGFNMAEQSPHTCPACGSPRFRCLREQFSYMEQALDSVTYTLKCEDCGNEWSRTVERRARTQPNNNE
jgi:hypothetical protein